MNKCLYCGENEALENDTLCAECDEMHWFMCAETSPYYYDEYNEFDGGEF